MANNYDAYHTGLQMSDADFGMRHAEDMGKGANEARFLEAH